MYLTTGLCPTWNANTTRRFRVVRFYIVKLLQIHFWTRIFEDTEKIIERAGRFNRVIINRSVLEFIIEIIYRISLFKWVIKTVDYQLLNWATWKTLHEKVRRSEIRKTISLVTIAFPNIDTRHFSHVFHLKLSTFVKIIVNSHQGIVEDRYRSWDPLGSITHLNDAVQKSQPFESVDLFRSGSRPCPGSEITIGGKSGFIGSCSFDRSGRVQIGSCPVQKRHNWH